MRHNCPLTACLLLVAAPALGAPFQIVTGTGSSLPNVRAFDRGTVSHSFLAYNPAFTGGVRVAAGDVNGDGVADIVTAPGTGLLSHIQVFSGKDLSVLGSFLAYDPAFLGGVYVAAGDIDGDGVADIVTAPDAGGSPQVKVFSGAGGAVLHSFFAYNPAFTGGVRVAAGDVNGDGVADIVTAPGTGLLSHIQVFSGKDLSVLGSFLAYDPAFLGGVYVAAGDIDGDGVADIVTAPDAGGSPHVKVFSGAGGAVLHSFFAYDPSFTGGVRVAPGDVNGDGWADIVTAPGTGHLSDTRVFSGKDLAVLDSFFAYDTAFSGGAYVAAVPEPTAALSGLWPALLLLRLRRRT